MFINDQSLELETMGPLSTLPPGGAVEYAEEWALFKSVLGPSSEQEIDAVILPRTEEAGQWFRK